MKLQNEKKVIGQILQALSADSLDLKVYNELLSQVCIGNWEGARVICKNSFAGKLISKDNYDALLFTFVAAQVLWGDEEELFR